MNEEETEELLKFLKTDYGRGYLNGLVCGLSMFLKILKKQSKFSAFIKSWPNVCKIADALEISIDELR